MNKKIGILVLVLFAIGICWIVARERSCMKKVVYIPINENDSKLQIGEKMIEKYFCGCIKNCQVNEIRTNGFRQDGEQSFVTAVFYSTKPFLSLNWIKNQSMFLVITKENKNYKLQSVILEK